MSHATYLGSYTVLFNERLLRKMELQRIVRTQADVEAAVEKDWEWVSLIVQEQSIIGQW